MADSEYLSPSATGDEEGTPAYHPPSNLPCNLPLSSPLQSENHDVVHWSWSNSTRSTYAVPGTYAHIETQPSSICTSLSVSDGDSDRCIIKSYTVPSSTESDVILTERDRCCSMSLPRSPAPSVVASGSRTSSHTLIGYTSNDEGHSSQSRVNHGRHAASPTTGHDDFDERSYDGSTAIGEFNYTRTEIEEVSTSMVSASTSGDAVAVERMAHMDEVDRHLFEYNLKHLGKQQLRQRYLAEDTAEAPWTVFHLRVRPSLLHNMTKHLQSVEFRKHMRFLWFDIHRSRS
jgi:hypothetical protein